jgi:hypothetical protein
VGNRGEEAAEAALQMAEWIHQLGNDRAGRSHRRLSQATLGSSRTPGPRSNKPRRPHGTR